MNLVYLVIVFWFLAVFCTPFIKEEIPDDQLELIEIFSKYDYYSEEHTVTTKDGYLLKLFRLLKREIFDSLLHPVYLMHGMGGCANNWILRGANESLPFMLANQGFDVWIVSARGTIHSMKHVKWDSLVDKEFWRFSWHEIGVYDMTVTIDFVLNATGFDQVALIAHSEGSTSFFAMASDLAEYDKKILLSIHLGPPVFFRSYPFPIITAISGLASPLNNLMESIGWKTIVPFDYRYFDSGLNKICQMETFRNICHIAVANLFYDPDQINMTSVPYIFSKVPCGGSVREMFHYLQNINKGDFVHFDYGPKKNLRIYNSTEAPFYNLGNVKSPTAIYYGKNDYFCMEEDAKILASRLPNVVVFKPVNNLNWTHMDFLIAKDAAQETYAEIIKLIKEYNC